MSERQPSLVTIVFLQFFGKHRARVYLAQGQRAKSRQRHFLNDGRVGLENQRYGTGLQVSVLQ